MRIYAVILALFLFNLIPGAAYAVNWQHIGTSNSGNSLYIDKDSIEYKPGYVFFADKMTLTPSNSMYKDGGRYLVSYNGINCTKNSYQSIKIILFNEKDKVISIAEGEPSSIPDGSIMGDFKSNLCK